MGQKKLVELTGDRINEGFFTFCRGGGGGADHITEVALRLGFTVQFLQFYLIRPNSD